VTVRADMPHGVLTQWYPAVTAFAPAILAASMGPLPIMDPVSEIHYPYAAQRCIDKYASLMNGLLDWGQVEILARDLTLASPLPDAPLDRYTWSYARQVAANAVRVRNPMGRAGMLVLNDPQTERFLFYRGLGNFALPMQVTAATLLQGGETIHMSPPVAGPIFLLNVGANQATFTRLEALPKQSTIETPLPDLTNADPLDTFVERLAGAMTEALAGTGLYRDEAAAMVNTWRQQWFRTPGVRVLYFAPASWLEQELPLSVTPAPDITTRVMVIRVEVLTNAVEAADVNAAIGLDSTEDQGARTYFRNLGRFAEPRLRRAQHLLGGRAMGQAFLAELEGPNVMGVSQ
jgi:hypothetical protein